MQERNVRVFIEHDDQCQVCVGGPCTCDRLRPDWDSYYLAGARWVASRADCQRARHGAILVADNRVVSTGYNGSPRGDQRSCLAGDCPRGLMNLDDLPHLAADYSNCIALHAEQNAIAYAREPADTIYITGPPCDGCRKLIAAAGIERVVYPEVVLLDEVAPLTPEQVQWLRKWKDDK